MYKRIITPKHISYLHWRTLVIIFHTCNWLYSKAEETILCSFTRIYFTCIIPARSFNVSHYLVHCVICNFANESWISLVAGGIAFCLQNSICILLQSKCILRYLLMQHIDWFTFTCCYFCNMKTRMQAKLLWLIKTIHAFIFVDLTMGFNYTFIIV